jgi:mono/diheme cytochrome c family protein
MSRRAGLLLRLLSLFAQAAFIAPGQLNVQPDSANPAAGEFFEMRVRPILSRNCFACHTNSALGGLRIDSREGLLKGGKSGPSVIPGKASESILIAAVERTHARLKMPPQGALKAEEVADLRKWIDQGAAWPSRSAGMPPPTHSITQEQRSFWSFQRVRKPAVPASGKHRWASSDIDRFLIAKIQAAGLQPAAPADKRTLIRRVTLDLIGVPPTPEEIAAFLADRSPDAFEKVVDRLLASPHYGERWARHWLDLARYSDGQGAARDDEPYPNAFRYRDWVIGAFNSDMAYDVFIKAQIAADRMPDGVRESLLPGLGFQALGESDVDRVDVTTRVFLGLTVGCAQCHDHKFDPIPTRDYYAMLGVFRSSEAGQHPLVDGATVDAYKKARKTAADRKDELKQATERQVAQVVDVLASQTQQYVFTAWRLIANSSLKSSELAEQAALDPETLERWVRYLQNTERDHKYMDRWDGLMRRPGGIGNASEDEVMAVARHIHDSVAEVLSQRKAIEDRNYVKLGGREGMKDTAKVISTLVEALPIEAYYFWRDMASGPYKVEDLNFKGGIYHYPAKEAGRFLGAHWKRYLERLQSESAAAEKAVPPLYPFWHVLKDSAKPANIRIAIRGDEANRGEEAPRAFLSILCDGDPKPFKHGSGRLELANAIASPDNPLTARVIVNRIWQHHFGHGIVRSTGNFGQLGDRPSHPELLDYLAARFIESGWSIKAMHREILLTSAYRMSSSASPESAAKDPDNYLFSRAHVWERMDAESLRDSILAVSGSLDRTIGGPPQPLTDDYRRRTIYATISRSKPDRTMAMFDFPDPNATSEQRIVTVGPLQRLFFLNSKFVAAQSKAFAERLARESGPDDRKRILRAYDLLFGRPAAAEEIRAGLEYLKSEPDPWPKYAQVLFGTAEFNTIQ